MPASSTRDRRAPACALAASIALLLIPFTSAGCGVFRCRQVSDEAVAAARQLSLQGIDCQQRGQWDQAEVHFASAVARCPRDERARCGYAESLWRRGDVQAAVQHMEEGVRLSGHDPARLVQLGEMYRSQGDLHRAGLQAQQAIAADPQLASAWALAGHVQMAEDRRTEALGSFHRALALQEHLPDVQLAVAKIYMQERRPQRALATLQSLAASFPAGQLPVEVLVQEGFALREMGRHQDAATRLAEAAGKSEPTPDLLCELGRTQLLAGESSAARSSAAAGLARNPQHAGCLALASELGGSAQGVIASAGSVIPAARLP
jgi:tetratricopeptide (TPR) repeat protein